MRIFPQGTHYSSTFVVLNLGLLPYLDEIFPSGHTVDFSLNYSMPSEHLTFEVFPQGLLFLRLHSRAKKNPSLCWSYNETNPGIAKQCHKFIRYDNMQDRDGHRKWSGFVTLLNIVNELLSRVNLLWYSPKSAHALRSKIQNIATLALSHWNQCITHVLAPAMESFAYVCMLLVFSMTVVSLSCQSIHQPRGYLNQIAKDAGPSRSSRSTPSSMSLRPFLLWRYIPHVKCM